MAKDPAFLFYSKDWLTGTVEMLPAEKGVYIDLLCYQHQNGSIPNDINRLSRMVGLSVSEFELIWKNISANFQRMDDRLVNRKLSEIIQERQTKGHRNTISGTFASVLRKMDLTKKQYTAIRSHFKIDDFTEIPTERLSERLSEWITKCLKSIEDGDGTENPDDDHKKGVQGEKQEKVAYAENVLLTETEHAKLCEKYGPDDVDRMVEVLSSYKLSNGKRYKSDYGAILNWVAERVLEENTKKLQYGARVNKGKYEPRFDEIDRIVDIALGSVNLQKSSTG